MRKFIIALLSAAIALGACGEEEATPEPDKAETTDQEKEQPAAKVEEKPEPEKKEPEKEKTPEEKIREAIEDTVVTVESVNGQFTQAPYTVQVEFKGAESITNKMTVKGFKMDIKYILYAIKDSGVDEADIGNVGVTVNYPLVDAYGNSEDQAVIKSDFSGETLGKMADESSAFDMDNIPVIADNWWEHPAVR